MSDKDETVEWLTCIRNRTDFARQWQAEWQTHQELATKCRYVRIQKDGFSAISISSTNPCGRLISKDGRYLSEVRQTIGEAIQCTLNAVPVDDPGDYFPGKNKKEHRIQAFLIRHALMNNKAMHALFTGFGEAFDDLWFVTDELTAGEHRADIIALGRKSDKYFPVFIELKVGRDLTELIRQLEGIRNAMRRVEGDFKQFLASASGVPADKINFDEHRLMLIWCAPKNKEGVEDRSVDAFRHDKNGITAVYTEDVENKSYSFVRWPRALCQTL